MTQSKHDEYWAGDPLDFAGVFHYNLFIETTERKGNEVVVAAERPWKATLQPECDPHVTRRVKFVIDDTGILTEVPHYIAWCGTHWRATGEFATFNSAWRAACDHGWGKDEA